MAREVEDGVGDVIFAVVDGFLTQSSVGIEAVLGIAVGVGVEIESPGVAEGIFEAFIQENAITVYRDEWLNRADGVEIERGVISAIATLSGKTFRGRVFRGLIRRGFCRGA